MEVARSWGCQTGNREKQGKYRRRFAEEVKKLQNQRKTGCMDHPAGAMTRTKSKGLGVTKVIGSQVNVNRVEQKAEKSPRQSRGTVGRIIGTTMIVLLGSTSAFGQFLLQPLKIQVQVQPMKRFSTDVALENLSRNTTETLGLRLAGHPAGGPERGSIQPAELRELAESRPGHGGSGPGGTRDHQTEDRSAARRVRLLLRGHHRAIRSAHGRTGGLRRHDDPGVRCPGDPRGAGARGAASDGADRCRPGFSPADGHRIGRHSREHGCQQHGRDLLALDGTHPRLGTTGGTLAEAGGNEAGGYRDHPGREAALDATDRAGAGRGQM
jgi:hypothetical protein